MIFDGAQGKWFTCRGLLLTSNVGPELHEGYRRGEGEGGVKSPAGILIQTRALKSKITEKLVNSGANFKEGEIILTEFLINLLIRQKYLISVPISEFRLNFGQRYTVKSKLVLLRCWIRSNSLLRHKGHDPNSWINSSVYNSGLKALFSEPTFAMTIS